MADEVKEYIKTHALPSLGDPSDIESRRNHPTTKSMLNALPSTPSGLEETDIQIPIPNGEWTSRAIVTRAVDAPPGPLIVLYHGGGFAMGQPEGCLDYARGFAKLFKAVVVSPSYRLAPEYKFPTGVNDAWHALKWIGTNAASLGADPSKGFIVGGSSAGGSFGGVLARRSVAEGLSPPLTGHWLAYPAMGQHDASSSIETDKLLPEAQKYKDLWGMSWKQNAEAVVLDAKSASILFGFLSPDFSSPLWNPLTKQPHFELSKLPKALVQVAGLDLTRDDGIVYAYALEDAGAEVRLLAYAGMPHAFPGFMSTMETSKKALLELAQAFGWMLGVDVDVEKAKEAMYGNH
ncbi:hypothetical protein EJ02DRAFT_454132 [Clathrospora elynae]|uniref:Alpha/beta hydrolase fold-3 domain-containing protein n=1 Tax=Clathrospora elynae TaxID=706981 RepID=A0A6A5SSD2_9PLEO|nr:hypothetical protein EJ02DRAFT_454132 [Clathrospora elynae]